MKLFIWKDPYSIDYGGAIAYAIAPDVESARKAIKAGGVSYFGHEPESEEIENLNIDRDPDRVLDGPYGEIYEWEK